MLFKTFLCKAAFDPISISAAAKAKLQIPFVLTIIKLVSIRIAPVVQVLLKLNVLLYELAMKEK